MSFGRDNDRSETRSAMKDTIDDVADADESDAHGAPVGDVVQALTEEYAGPGKVGEVLAELLRHGEIYEPRPGRIKNTERGD